MSEEEFRPNPTQSPWAATPAPAKTTPITNAFTLGDHASSYYTRVVPDHFSGAADDQLMNSLISRYSLEGNTGGKPNGQFYLTKEAAKAVSQEVVTTHLGFTGKKRDDFLNQKFERLWKEYDNIDEGFLDVSRVPMLLRTLVGEVETNIGLQ